MELVRFIFQDFAHWLGAFLMLTVVVQGLTVFCVAVFRGRR